MTKSDQEYRFHGTVHSLTVILDAILNFVTYHKNQLLKRFEMMTNRICDLKTLYFDILLN